MRLAALVIAFASALAVAAVVVLRRESAKKLEKRHRRYIEPGSGMFKIVDAETGEAVGSVGFWECEWQGQQVYETGWSVLPEFQGRGIASRATALVIELARRERSTTSCTRIHRRKGRRSSPPRMRVRGVRLMAAQVRNSRPWRQQTSTATSRR